MLVPSLFASNVAKCMHTVFDAGKLRNSQCVMHLCDKTLYFTLVLHVMCQALTSMVLPNTCNRLAWRLNVAVYATSKLMQQMQLISMSSTSPLLCLQEHQQLCL